MGTSHILYLYDDALTPARDDPSLRDALALDLGRAILALTLDPDFFTGPDAETKSPRRLTWTRVGSHGNALHWCDEAHSDDVRIYVWSGNCLRELGDLDKSLTPAIRDVIERTLAGRPGGR